MFLHENVKDKLNFYLDLCQLFKQKLLNNKEKLNIVSLIYQYFRVLIKKLCSLFSGLWLIWLYVSI